MRAKRLHSIPLMLIAIAAGMAAIVGGGIVWIGRGGPSEPSAVPAPASGQPAPTTGASVREDRAVIPWLREGGSLVASQPGRPMREDTRRSDPARGSERGPGDSDRSSRAAASDPEAGLAQARSILARAIEDSLPEWRPSEPALDALADATLRIRRAQSELRALSGSPDEAAARARWRRDLEQAIVDFTALAGMSPAEFSTRVAPPSAASGLTDDEPAGEILIRPMQPAGEILIRPMRPAATGR